MVSLFSPWPDLWHQECKKIAKKRKRWDVAKHVCTSPYCVGPLQNEMDENRRCPVLRPLAKDAFTFLLFLCTDEDDVERKGGVIFFNGARSIDILYTFLHLQKSETCVTLFSPPWFCTFSSTLGGERENIFQGLLLLPSSLIFFTQNTKMTS